MLKGFFILIGKDSQIVKVNSADCSVVIGLFGILKSDLCSHYISLKNIFEGNGSAEVVALKHCTAYLPQELNLI